jgi:alkylhydroperoxidase family enzyme
MNQPIDVRIPPLPPAQFSPEQRELAGHMAQYNFTRVMVQHLDLYRAYIPLAEKLMARSILPPKDREVIILRTLVRCGESYDLAHHEFIGRQVGLTTAEIDAVAAGCGKCLSAIHQTLIQGTDELLSEHRIGAETWRLLSQHYDRQALMEIVFLVGGYTMMAMATSSFGIPPDEEQG